MPLPIFDAVDAFSEFSTRRSPAAVAQLTGIAWAAARSFFSCSAQPLTSANKPNAQRPAPIFVVLIIFSPRVGIHAIRSLPLLSLQQYGHEVAHVNETLVQPVRPASSQPASRD